MLANTVGFDLVDTDLGKGIEIALQTALSGGAVFHNGTAPLSIFRKALIASIRDIESHPRGRLFQELLAKSPYEDAGEIPAEMVGKFLSDYETTSVIAFIYSHMVNFFQSSITECLLVKLRKLLVQGIISGGLPFGGRRRRSPRLRTR